MVPLRLWKSWAEPRFTLFNRVPSCEELKMVNQDGDTVGAHEIVGVSGKTLVLPSFRVT